MAARAGIVVTGTEVLTGRVMDRNGPWLAEQLRTLGVDVGRTVVVGDRREDLAAALRFQLADHDLVLTTGGLGPTADDLTAEVVAEVQGRAMALDPELEQRIGEVVGRLNRHRGWSPSPEIVARSVRKQAMVPEAATVLGPVGTAPGLVVPGPDGAPPVLVLPGPPSELQAMWPEALAADPVRAVLAAAVPIHQAEVRIWGPPEAELADLLRAHEQVHGSLESAGLEVTTCIRDGELEVVTRFAPAAAGAYDALLAALRDGFGDQLYADDGRAVDDVVAELLLARGATVATAESCTAGLLAGRIADRPGASAYLVGGFVTYADTAKTTELGVPASLIAEVGAVSREVAEAMATGARTRLGTTAGIGVTGVAGPGGGTADKPVGLVHIAVDLEGRLWHQQVQLGGGREVVRRRTVATALQLLRTALAD
ncbi:competence/damage-inducible protein A [Nocardioides sp. zg-536]|uniref:CinA-like protein n=1 Tax=Nocardioides faecalis TaxID=2803858 RepID=A0A938Y4D2_9ACTN|nr:competence/damage-inducible protein A [Nocardioides faecalis]MBM9461671.1 competence/damage-inducible protein A [Nocardioides faecalis]QVI59938.1 competence/damage-inducible protein A [Nocardioides faecalis]